MSAWGRFSYCYFEALQAWQSTSTLEASFAVAMHFLKTHLPLLGDFISWWFRDEATHSSVSSHLGIISKHWLANWIFSHVKY